MCWLLSSSSSCRFTTLFLLLLYPLLLFHLYQLLLMILQRSLSLCSHVTLLQLLLHSCKLTPKKASSKKKKKKKIYTFGKREKIKKMSRESQSRVESQEERAQKSIWKKISYFFLNFLLVLCSFQQLLLLLFQSFLILLL